MPKTRTCEHCQGTKWVFDPQTGKYNKPCPACKGKGYIVIP